MSGAGIRSYRIGVPKVRWGQVESQLRAGAQRAGDIHTVVTTLETRDWRQRCQRY